MSRRRLSIGGNSIGGGSIRSNVRAECAIVNLSHKKNCTLPDYGEADSFEAAGNKFMRWLNGLRLISISNPITSKYFRSESAVKQEKIRHSRLHYWYIVHPLSKLKIYFDIWQLLFYLTSMVVKPMNAALPTPMQLKMRYFPEISTALDVLSWMTIILTFFNGFIIEDSRTMVLEPKRIAWNYVSSMYFICDVLSSVPILPLLHLYEVFLGTRFHFTVGFVYLLCQLKLIRMISVIKYINRLALYFKIKSAEKVFIFMFTIITLLVVHNFALFQLLLPKLVRKYFSKVDDESQIWYVKHNLHKNTFLQMYIQAVFKSSAFMLGIRIDFYRMADQEEDYLLAIATYIVGKVLVCATYVIVAVTLLRNKSMEVKFFSIINQLDEYMRQKQLPLNLRDRIKKYYNFKFQQKYFNSEMIHDMLPAKLKKDINLHACRTLIQNVSLFDQLTAEEISNVVDMLVPEIFLPKDTIMQAGSYGNSMYFISSGTVAVFTHSGREVCHLEDGAYFGEVALVLKVQHRSATVIAIETTHVYVLKKKDFNRCMLKNPKVMKKILKQAHKRYSQIRKLDEEYKKKLFEQVHGGDHQQST